MALTRLPKWDTELLPAFLYDRKDQAFKWGVNDCSLFAADAVQAITGTDIASDFRRGYTDHATSLAVIQSVSGGSTVADAAAYCAAKHNMPEYTFPLMAQRGDLVAADNDGQLIAGVVHGDGRHVVTVGESGLMYLPITQIKRAWKV